MLLREAIFRQVLRLLVRPHFHFSSCGMMVHMQIGLNGLRRAEVWIPWTIHGVKFLVILAGAWVFSHLAKKLLTRVRLRAVLEMERRGDHSDRELEKRAATVVSVLFTIIQWMIWIVAWGMALYELNFRIEPLLEGLGIAGIALGLGAQTLIKDWLAGLFLLLEDQIRIGDLVTINSIAGTVEEINLRTTQMRAENGAVHMFPNGSITALSNLSREYSYFVFETTLAHKADAVKALDIVKQVGAEIAEDARYSVDIVAPLEIFGVEKLGERGAFIRARIKTRPARHLYVGREFNLRVKERFDAAGITFPPP
jgi:small-conductance mechanosensitive channel